MLRWRRWLMKTSRCQGKAAAHKCGEHHSRRSCISRRNRYPLAENCHDSLLGLQTICYTVTFYSLQSPHPCDLPESPYSNGLFPFFHHLDPPYSTPIIHSQQSWFRQEEQEPATPHHQVSATWPPLEHHPLPASLER